MRFLDILPQTTRILKNLTAPVRNTGARRLPPRLKELEVHLRLPVIANVYLPNHWLDFALLDLVN